MLGRSANSSDIAPVSSAVVSVVLLSLVQLLFPVSNVIPAPIPGPAFYLSTASVDPSALDYSLLSLTIVVSVVLLALVQLLFPVSNGIPAPISGPAYFLSTASVDPSALDYSFLSLTRLSFICVHPILRHLLDNLSAAIPALDPLTSLMISAIGILLLTSLSQLTLLLTSTFSVVSLVPCALPADPLFRNDSLVSRASLLSLVLS
jgi:hypothetical protein